MSNVFSLTALNLALDGNLEEFIDAYKFTYDIYLTLLKEHTDINLDFSEDRQLINALAISVIMPQLDFLVFHRLRIFTTKYKSIHLEQDDFRYFDFFDVNKIKHIIRRKKFEAKYLSKDYSIGRNRISTENTLEDVSIDLEQFLDNLRRVIINAIYRRTHIEDKTYTVFQARKDVDKRIDTRMKMRHNECIIKNSSHHPLTNDPLFLYDSLNNISCKRNGHKIVAEKYYTKHLENDTIVVLPVHYCTDCKRFLCGTVSFSLFKDFFGKFIIDTRVLNPIDDSNWQIHGESKLHRLGYNVINGDMSIDQRQNLLINLIESKIISYFEVVATIEQDIRIFKTHHKMQKAVNKWREDLKFVHEYSLSKSFAKKKIKL